ncbi:MAG: hypothetical protein JO213_10015 [Alphaproteobacteria bacterium]|nr:hypothetical protein [Alphaproteobacteria bacterium]MBV9585208.1 hypothetical protein [Alphaproteobacteria bacterium]
MPREPATWSTRERAVYYRMDATRLREMAEAASCAAARELLVALARRYRQAASRIEKRVLAPAG